METKNPIKIRFKLTPSLPYQTFFWVFAGLLAFGAMISAPGPTSGKFYFAAAALIAAVLIFISRTLVVADEDGIELSVPNHDESNVLPLVERIHWSEGIEYAIRKDAGWEVLSLSPTPGFDWLSHAFPAPLYLFLYSNEGLLLRTQSTSGDLHSLLDFIDGHPTESSTKNETFKLCIACARKSVVEFCRVRVKDKLITLDLQTRKITGTRDQFKLYHGLNPTRAPGRANIAFDGKVILEDVLSGSALQKFAELVS